MDGSRSSAGCPISTRRDPLTRGRALIAQLALLGILTVVISWFGLICGSPWVLPALQTLPAWLFMAAALKRGRRRLAIGLVLWWALFMAVTVVAFTLHDPAKAIASIANGEAYRDEMLSWIRTGQGSESTPSIFIPRHLAHAAIFCVVGLSTAGIASMAMGAFLMNYMSFYVGDLFSRCIVLPGTQGAMLIAWNPWSIIRVVSFIVLGVILAEPLLSRWPGYRADPAGKARWVVLALSGLALDILVKTFLAPLWPALLRPCLG